MSKSFVRIPFILLVLFSAIHSSGLKAKIKFSQEKLVTNFKITHPVLNLQFNNQQPPLLVILGQNDKGQRLVRLYQREPPQEDQTNGSYTQIASAEIPQHFLSYDTLKTAQGDKLLFQSNNQIVWFDPKTSGFFPLVSSPSIYLRSQAQFLAKRKFVKDINGDGLDDIYTPDFKGLHIFLQNQQGTFEQQILPIEPKISLDEDSASYSETPFFIADINLDNKLDLLTVMDSAFAVYLQNEEGKFTIESKELILPIEIKALNWWEIREYDGQSPDQNALAYRTLEQIEDINNDGLADLLVRFSQTSGVLDRQNNYEVYLGKKNDKGLLFTEKPNSLLAAGGTTVAVKIIDLDGDKKSEIMLSSLDIGVSQIIGALLSGSIDQDVDIYKMDQESNYGKDPSVNKEVDLTFSLSSGKSGEPVVKLADFDGDGLKDLLFSSGEKKLKIFQGTTKSRLFKKRSQKHKVLLPKNGNHVEILDLNLDGKQDIIIRYGRQDDSELSNQLVLLFAL